MQSAFIKSFRAKGFIHVVMLDFIYYTILLFLSSFYVYRILPSFLSIIDAVDLLKSGALFSSTQELLTQTDVMSANWLSFKIYTIIIAVVLFFNYCIFKYLVWKRISQKQQVLKDLLKSIGLFSLLNFILIFVYSLLILFSYFIFVSETFNIFLFFVLPIIIIYTQNLIHPLFMQTQSFKDTAKQYFAVGIKKLYRFIIPYTLMITAFLLVMYIVPLLLFLPSALYTLWYVLVFVIYFSWTKYYFHALIIPSPEKISQKQKVEIPLKKKKEKKQ
jgi:hypothetical protein